MADDFVLAIDQGSSSTKALLVSADGAIVRRCVIPVTTDYPRPGWVEHSPTLVEYSVRRAIDDCVEDVDPRAVVAIGLSTQRESIMAWDAETGTPIGPLISWQDRRTAEICRQLTDAGHALTIRERTGLPLDPMFSAPKARWLLDTFDPDRTAARHRRLILGTVDSWLLTRLAGTHDIEVGNASRTQLMNVHTRTWDDELLAIFDVPAETLPTIRPSIGPFAAWRGAPLRDGTPITAVMADSHAALFAHGIRTPGGIKATYGTGSSVMGIIDSGTPLDDALCLTVAWDDGEPAYAVEANIRSSGATIEWLGRTVGRTATDLATLALSVPDTGGVYLVPAFGGLGAPWWDDAATAIISGLTLGTTLAHLARAALESIAFQIDDVLTVADRLAPISTIHADGGAASNDMLMQLQADLAARPVQRSAVSELSALGAAYLAGRTAGIWDERRLSAFTSPGETFHPGVAAQNERTLKRAAWADAIRRAKLAP
ncbi:MAG TPA: FGGY family carbohydrate kinase [Micromonosporaceae bacterium]|nr:FGGY family carbohydrate kinase [Micromonosporaceae bacterium]